MDKAKLYQLIKPIIIAETYQCYLDRLPYAISPNYDFNCALRAYENDRIFNRQVERCLANIMSALNENPHQLLGRKIAP